MRNIAIFSYFTLKSLVKDRVFFVIIALWVLFLCVPVFSSFSMRQCQEVGISMCLSINSFILLLLSIFSGISTVWRDLEKRSVYTLLSYPVSRSHYLLGRFLGCVILLFIMSGINFLISVPVIKICAGMYKSDLPILWKNIALAYGTSFMKFVLLNSISFLIISFSTSFFTSFFITIAVYISGNSIQSVYDYVLREASQKYSLWFKYIVKAIYYILPNFTAFDLIPYAAYSLKLDYHSICMAFFYFIIFTSITLSLSCIIFSKRDLL